MDYIESEYFSYKDNQLYCESIPVKTLAREFGTPLYVYSKKFFRDKFTEFTNAFSTVNHTIFFAAKSNFNLNVIKLFYDLGSGIDVNSMGELYRALKIGADPKRILLTGVGKTKEEIKRGLELDILLIKAESIEEVYLIDKIAGEIGKKAHVAIRVNPDVDPQTHPYISTGLAENKFGIPASQAIDIFAECSKLTNIEVTGIDMHIGSQITMIDPFVEAVVKMTELTKKIIAKGVKIKHFDVGGGFGIRYKDEKPFTADELASALIPIFMQLDCEIFFEPGRFITANGGILLTEVLYTKSNNEKNFVVVDGAMTDLLRPSIYGAYHHIQPAVKSDMNDITADIVGPVCESGDFLGKERLITDTKSGDLMAVLSCGAYGMVMSSNYNSRRRAPEIIVDIENYFTTRSRETYEHLLYDEKIVDGLH
ncbi:MAG: diaminopimelate decarboxylase [Melioribacteraceae bacterium]|nr:diaminopimelate decarboxylase [Melioribacteraceae bacterium]